MIPIGAAVVVVIDDVVDDAVRSPFISSLVHHNTNSSCRRNVYEQGEKATIQKKCKIT